MVIIHFNGLDMFLIGELNEKIHSKIARAYGIDDEDLIFSASDSFVFYKGHEQTSFNLVCKIEAPEQYVDVEEEVASILMEETKNYSVHARILFSYFDDSHYYERINREYPEYIVTSNDAVLSEDEYDQEREYSEDEIYTGNIFEDDDKEVDDRPLSLNDFFKR